MTCSWTCGNCYLWNSRSSLHKYLVRWVIAIALVIGFQIFMCGVRPLSSAHIVNHCSKPRAALTGRVMGLTSSDVGGMKDVVRASLLQIFMCGVRPLSSAHIVDHCSKPRAPLTGRIMELTSSDVGYMKDVVRVSLLHGRHFYLTHQFRKSTWPDRDAVTANEYTLILKKGRTPYRP